MKRFGFAVVLMLVSATLAAQFKLYEKGHDSYTAGKYDEAVKNFSEYLTKATRDKSLDVEVYYLRALSYYKQNKFEPAVTDFEEAILLDHKNSGNIYWFKAKCHDKLGTTEDAIRAYTQAIRLLSDNKEAKAKLLFERSQLYTRAGNMELALADLQEGTKTNPSNTDIKKELDAIQKQSLATRSTPEKSNSSNTKKEDKKTVQPVVQKTEEPKQQAVIQKPTETVVEKQTTPVTPTVSQPTLADLYKDEKRYALVIGNSAYPKNIGALKNPANDATDVAQELKNSNFEVDLLINATYGQMRAAMLKFKEKVDGGDKDKTVALFYYAGHGLQHEDENFLVPIDAAVEFEDDIPRYCFPVQRMVLANMERSNSRMNVVILDACRNNPFPAANRSMEQGLGEMKRARGSFIAYATAPGSVASDGTGRNGLYTQELLKAMKKPGLTIEQVFKEVRANVLKLSSDRQNTWDSSNIIGEFYFKF